MATTVAWSDVEVGDALPSITARLQRVNLVMYAGASGDFNPIHWNETFAKAVGLPDVIAHGMLTMATAGRVVTDWVGDPGRVVDYFVRFSRPVKVPDTADGVVVRFSGKVTQVVEGVATVALEATCGDDKVLAAAKVEVRVD